MWGPAFLVSFPEPSSSHLESGLHSVPLCALHEFTNLVLREPVVEDVDGIRCMRAHEVKVQEAQALLQDSNQVKNI